jgi:hypothetical protein
LSFLKLRLVSTSKKKKKRKTRETSCRETSPA